MKSWRYDWKSSKRVREFCQQKEDKKYFILSPVKLFAIGLTKKCNTLTKGRKIIKLAAETAFKLWPEQKQQ